MAIAAAAASSSSSLFPKYPCLSRNSPRLPQSLRFSSTIRAVTLQPVKSERNQTLELEGDLFSCPICYEPLIRKGPTGLTLGAIYRSGFKCRKCDKTYSSKDNYLDLTVISGLKDYTEVKPASTELFRCVLVILAFFHEKFDFENLMPSVNQQDPIGSPFVSFLYERGWRQNFNRSGFPGPDEEFKMAQEYFKSAQGGLLVDVSCGSGLFSRKFAKSGAYSGVVALDFSENMLRQCYDFIKQDNTILTSNLALVRADVCRLPFASGFVDAVHAGAALHCWPSPSNAASVFSSSYSLL
ncbi:methyltransferase 11 domain-containing protein [Citrus sinensis]|uniref:Methyltransferase 11 domain-containing protein n=1 Tax=Citrus sinensis TaxID=2711 RepID=A0ACB8P8T9_CITSI|nr:methyltransferase 11 domain-containing protein [Citrus sinensis]